MRTAGETLVETGSLRWLPTKLMPNISAEAFEAIASTLPLGSVGYEAEPNERGERLIWLEDAMADRLGARRGPGESYSDVILRIGGREGSRMA